MACGITMIQNGTTVVCDNAGTSAHTGNHSGLLPSSWTLFTRTWSTSTRVSWKASVATAVKQKPAVLGESDFL